MGKDNENKKIRKKEIEEAYLLNNFFLRMNKILKKRSIFLKFITI